jgi:uncharacterized membrane protein YeaQ/YmgE (transglycosylase-associated protein family)
MYINHLNPLVCMSCLLSLVGAIVHMYINHLNPLVCMSCLLSLVGAVIHMYIHKSFEPTCMFVLFAFAGGRYRNYFVPIIILGHHRYFRPPLLACSTLLLVL